jgi:hypothetical protein
MCEPTTLAYAGLALSAVATGVGYVEQQNSANRQEAAINDAAAKDRAATQRMYQQINESAQDEQAQRHTEYLIDAARIKAIQGESGLSGASYDRQDQEAANNATSDMATIEKNRGWKAENAASGSQARGTQAAIQLAGVRRPSGLGAGLQIAGNGVSAYQQYRKDNPTTQPSFVRGAPVR